MKEPIYLVQTDTTVGFLCKNEKKLNLAKKRDENTPCIQVMSKFSSLKSIARVPNRYKNMVRKSKKTTFIYPNKKSVRVVKDCPHEKFLNVHGAMFSTSANITKHGFDSEYARGVADIIEEREGGFFETSASKIYKISHQKIIKVRS